MLLARLDTKGQTYSRLGHPRDYFEAKEGVELDWQEKRGVIVITQKREGKPPLVAAIVPISHVADLWPLEELAKSE